MRDPIEQLHRIQNAILKIAEYAKKGRQRFDSEEEIQLSVIYYLQTISEAANTISQHFKDHHSEIPWKQLTDFQNLITHYYLKIDTDALWNIVDNDLPNLEHKVDAALEETQKQISRNNDDHQPLPRSETVIPYAELLKAKRDEILRIAIKYGVSNIRIFGSIARGEADAASDIDLLVDVEPGRTLFDLSELLFDLQELLDHDVDLVTEKGLHNRIRERVLKEAIPL